MKTRFWLGILSLLLLAGCGGGAQDQPAAAVLTYLQSITAGDEERIASISCAEWEETARGEVASFMGVKARLEGVSCSSRSNSGDTAVVDCKGKIVATYNNEDADFPLEELPYRVIREGGEWRVCGYGE